MRIKGMVPITATLAVALIVSCNYTNYGSGNSILPIIISTAQLNSEANAQRNKVISATFCEAMILSTIATGHATSTQGAGRICAANMAHSTPITITTPTSFTTTTYNITDGCSSVDFLELGAGNVDRKKRAQSLNEWRNNVTISSNVTTSSGNATDVWVFQIDGIPTTSAAGCVFLSGGTRANSIIWQFAGQVTHRA